MTSKLYRYYLRKTQVNSNSGLNTNNFNGPLVFVLTRESSIVINRIMESLDSNTETERMRTELEKTRARLREEIERKMKLLQYIEGLQEYVGELESTVQRQAQQIQQQEVTLNLYLDSDTNSTIH